MTFEEADYPLVKYAYTRHPLMFCIIHGFVVATNIILLATGMWHWIWGVLCLASEAIYWLGSNQHRNRLRALELQEPFNPLNHYDDVCEGCNPVKMKDGKSPITDIVKYWAAVNNISRETAQIHLDDPIRRPLIEKRHKNYLNSPEFN